MRKGGISEAAQTRADATPQKEGKTMNELAMALQQPFDPALVEFRPQGKLNSEGKGRVVAYVDARAVQDRLDEVFGPMGWSFTWDTVDLGKGLCVRGMITVEGTIKADVSDALETDTEPAKTVVSDAEKRAAVQWGVGRYLYRLDAWYVKGKAVGNNWVPEDSEVKRLRAGLPRPTQQPAPAAPIRPQLAAVPQQEQSEQQPATEKPKPKTEAYNKMLNWLVGLGVEEADAKTLFRMELHGQDTRTTSLEEVSAAVDAVIKKYRTYDQAMAALEAEQATA